MANVAVIGAQWGDEGKGKIVDWLSSRADVVVRFQGGHNAGHTLVVDGESYKLSLLPSGVVRPGKLSVIGNGVVVDPWALKEEIARVEGQGVSVTPERLLLAENAVLILPIHQIVDRAREKVRRGGELGTTGRGIGPAYEDKVARRALRVCDLNDREALRAGLDEMLRHHNAFLRGAGEDPVAIEPLLSQLCTISDFVLGYAGVTWQRLSRIRRTGQRILFEGAQGVMLDIDHGTYPFVTSSNTVAAQAATGAGTGLGAVDHALGIVKAYTTRVGAGPFPTEQDNAIGRHLGERGREFGTVTGRQRRCGWFDSVLVRQAAHLAGLNGIALTKLDVLDGLERIQVCTGYRYEGAVVRHLPAGLHNQRRIEPVYETFAGWQESTHGARSWADLPAQAVKFIRRIEELIDTPVALVSTSPEREDTILVSDPFAD